ncbi:11262_t:CDS:2, partial [Scutellospora calospora]
NILESKELSELVSENSQSTIISEISNETVELKLDKIYFEESQEFYNNIERIYEINNNIDKIQEINSDMSNIGNIDDNIRDMGNIVDEMSDVNSELNYFNIIQEIHTDLYDSKIRSCFKTIPVSEIIKIINSDDDPYKNQHYTSQEKEK